MAAGDTNADLADALDEYAVLLDLSEANPFAARAYRRAADLIRGTEAPVAALVRAGRVRDLRGIGAGIEARLAELVETGGLAELDALRRTTSPELAAFGRMQGLPPRRLLGIGAALGIRTVDELRGAAERGRLREVHGVGPRMEERIRAALAAPAPAAGRPLLLHQAMAVCDAVAGRLGGTVAGDVRRWVDAPTRLVVVVPSDRPDEIRARFAALREIVAMAGPDVGVTLDGAAIELACAPPQALGTALVRATGSAEYVAALAPLPDCPHEEAVYAALGLPYTPPELREPGVPAAPASLLEASDIRGDLHCHTTWSDGRATVRELAEAARGLGHEYVAVCDHTRSVRVVPGLGADELRRQGEEIAAVNADLAPFRVLRGVECDILPDGRLDLPDDVLRDLDWVQISLHAGQRTPRRELTARVTHAMRHPAARCLSHPTGRIIGHRPENALDLERTIETALETGVALEVNGLPSRLDLSGAHVREAVAAGVRIVCSSDAHSAEGLRNVTFAVHTARRGGVPRSAVVNAQPLSALTTAP